jgi:hypothetical protein
VSWLAISAASSAFALACTGASTIPNEDNTGYERAPIAMTLQIDLSKHRWCQSPCRETEPIASVSKTEIVLKQDEYEDGDWLVVRLNRESGAYYSSWKAHGRTITETAQCQVQPFSGLPERRF